MAGLSNLKNLSQLAKAAQGKKGKEVLTLSVDEVVSRPQVRKRFRNIEELASTLLTEGQQSPIIVSPKREDGKYVIQKGERRWRACRHAGIETIDVIVNEKAQTDLDETAGELIENIQRDDLAPLEIAEALQAFIDEGWKQKQIANRIGKNITYVSTHLSLLRMPNCVRELYENDICTDTETLNSLRLLFDLNEGRCRAVCAVAQNEGITRKQSRELLNDAKRLKEETKKRAAPKPAKAVPQVSVEVLGQQVDQQHSQQEGNDAPEQTKGAASRDVADDAPDGDTSLAAPQRKKTASANQPDANNLHDDEQGSKEWKEVSPGSVVIAVNVRADGQVKRGILMMDRVALTSETVWVQLLNDQGREDPTRVLVTDVELLSVEG